MRYYDLKLLSIKRGHDQNQADLDAISKWVSENKMGLTMDKCSKIFLKDLNSFLVARMKC